MARPCLRPRSLEPCALLLFAAVVLSASEVVQQPPRNAGDLDTGAFISADSPDESSEAPAGDVSETSAEELVAGSDTPVVEAPAPVAEGAFQAPKTADVEAPTVERSAETVRKLVGDGPVGQSSASLLEALLTNLGNARKVGLTFQVEQAEATAKAMARDALTKAMAPAKTAATAFSVKLAFDQAARAGVPDSESDAAWETLRAEIRTMLVSAVAEADANRTAQPLQGLADALFIWRKLGFHTHHMDEEEDAHLMANGQAAFERQLQAAFAQDDLDTTALAVSLADKAGAHYEQRVKTWVEVTRKLRSAASDLEHQTLGSLLDVVQPAIDFPLPRTMELQSVEAAAQNLTVKGLKHCLEQNHSSEKHIDLLLTNVENARRTHLDTPDVAAAASTAKSHAAMELQKALSGPKGLESLQKIKDAFGCAARAGVPEDERGAAWQSLQAEIQTKLVNATAVASATRDTQSLRDLADAAFLWRKFSFPDAEPHVLLHAKEVYERQVEAAFNANDLDYTVLGVRLSGRAGAHCSEGARAWMDVYDRLVHTSPSVEQQPVEALVLLMKQAKNSGLPATSYAELVQRKALELSMGQLKAALSNNATSLETLLAALENARDVVTSSSNSTGRFLGESSDLSSAQTRVLEMTLAHLHHVVAERKDVGMIKGAFELAGRAGVLEAQRTSAWNGLQEAIQSQIVKATVDANKTRNTETIQELAHAVFMWRKLQFGGEDTGALKNAREVYEQQLESGLQAQDTDFTVLAVKLAERAGAKCSIGARTWADVASKVQRAAASINDQSLEALVELVSEANGAGFPRTSELRLLETTVQEAVAAQLKQTLPGGT